MSRSVEVRESLIAQHMQAGYSRELAERLSDDCMRRHAEAKAREESRPLHWMPSVGGRALPATRNKGQNSSGSYCSNLQEADQMNAAEALVYVQTNCQRALRSPAALAFRAASDSILLDAVEHAKQCLESTDGWDVHTLGHNIESNFPELEPEKCDDIARAVLKVHS